MILSKDQVAEYARIAYEARGETCVVAITDVVKHHLEDTKGKLLESRGDETLQLQGRAQAYQAILKFLTAPPRATL